MINKKNLLGRAPLDAGDKDAIHVAIVAVRAANAIEPGQRCSLNEHREAIAVRLGDKGVGIADPFRKGTILRGELFWMVLDSTEVPNVRHEWDHPTVDFSPPTRPGEANRWIQQHADEYGVTYKQLMDACAHVHEHNESVPYPGSKCPKDIEALHDESYDVWAEWSGETNTEFPNYGTECCPEYEYPEPPIFEVTRHPAPESK